MLVPPRCPVCGELGRGGEPLCARCLSALAEPRGVELAADGLDSLLAAFPLRGRAHRMVSAIKHRGMIALVDLAAGAIDDAIEIPLVDLTVVSVPPARLRLASRGFDPAGLLAAELADRTGLPRRSPLVRRDLSRQRGRGRGERLRSPPRIVARAGAPERVLLVDDVVTTGATMSAAARALRGAGAVKIHGLAFAATPKPA